MRTTIFTPVLHDGVLYAAGSRFVCSRCAGATALHTGRTLEGLLLRPACGRDVIAHVAEHGNRPLTCECRLAGRPYLAATFSMRAGLSVVRVNGTAQ